jgi:hypothetical protein
MSPTLRRVTRFNEVLVSTQVHLQNDGESPTAKQRLTRDRDQLVVVFPEAVVLDEVLPRDNRLEIARRNLAAEMAGAPVAGARAARNRKASSYRILSSSTDSRVRKISNPVMMLAGFIS